MTFLIVFYLLSVLGTHIGLYFFFKHNGIAPWKAFVPFLNKLEWQKMVGKKPSYLVWFFIPGANIIAAVSLMSELLDAHRIYGFKEHYLGILGSMFYFPYLFGKVNPKYYGPKGEIAGEKFKKPKPSLAREWTDTIVFALSAAMFIRMFIFENYTIPTSSLEGTLLVGDYLVVDKVTYGIRMPNTPLSFPLVHNTLPFTNDQVNSYLEWIKIPYYRLPKLRAIKRNDLVVFNYPEGDTVTTEYQSARMYTEMVAKEGREFISSQFHIVYRPVDKRDNYIKRCVAIPGDTLKIVNGILSINGKAAYIAPKMQTSYYLKIDPMTLVNPAQLQDDLLDLDVNVAQNVGQTALDTFIVNTDKETALKIRQLPYAKSLTEIIYPAPDTDNFMFPHDKVNFPWSIDNYGPLVMPQKGATVTLTPQNIAIYQRIIEIYEHHTFENKNGYYHIDGKPTNQYTFQMDYYFMMGDNRHNSQDSRAWGFVPEDHIVGRPLLIFMSRDALKGKIRWNRLFTFTSKYTPN